MQPRGSTPWKFHDLRDALKSLWNLDNWHMLSIGLGYFVFEFASEETRDSLLNTGVLKLPVGHLYLQPWVPNFDPAKAASSLARVWLRMHGIGYEFMHSSVILSLATAFGRPIRIDTDSLDRCFGNYVRVLVEVDLAQPLETSVMLESPSLSLTVDGSFEKLPAFCSSCVAIGHSTMECQRGKRRKVQDGISSDALQQSEVPKTSSLDTPAPAKGSTPAEQPFQQVLPRGSRNKVPFVPKRNASVTATTRKHLLKRLLGRCTSFCRSRCIWRRGLGQLRLL